MVKIIAASKTNIASANIAALLEQRGIKPIYFEQDVIYLPVENLRADLLLIASSHKSAEGVPSLTCHTPGNWSSADYGGQPRTLSIAPAFYLREILLALADGAKERGLKHLVCFEVTHHGPTPYLPTVFVEVGSMPEHWKDLSACAVVADAIERAYKHEPETDLPVAIGFGGPHYAPNFTKRVLQGKYAVGHICPKYRLDEIDYEMVKQAIERTSPRPDFAVIDWKGATAQQRQKLVGWLERAGLSWEKV